MALLYLGGRPLPPSPRPVRIPLAAATAAALILILPLLGTGCGTVQSVGLNGTPGNDTTPASGGVVVVFKALRPPPVLVLRLSAFSPTTEFVRRSTNACAALIVEEHFTPRPVGNVTLKPL